MFLNQVPTMPGIEMPVIADLDPERARLACRSIGWDAARVARAAFVSSGAEACGHPDSAAAQARREMERRFASPQTAAAQ